MHASGGAPFQQADIVWSAFPSGQFTFSPNPSTTDGNGNATTQITAVSNVPSTEPVTIFARAYNETLEYMDIGADNAITFTAGTFPQGAANLAITPVNGDLLSDPVDYLVQATYTDAAGGSPIQGQTVQWTSGNPQIVSVTAGPPTDANGVTVARITCRPTAEFTTVTLTASVQNPNTQATDTSQIVLCVRDAELAPPDTTGYLSVNPAGTGPYMEGTTYPFNVRYRASDGSAAVNKPVCWVASPSDRITFSTPNPVLTGPDGRESNGVTCSSGPSLPSAIISAGAPNGLTGSYDHGQSYVPF
ncbi:Ig-like domain-containing protein, partial [Phyllobacterium salinisoli]|uniref:Ig-like domain-containing protein n=1 Tax=Phyllobacterium salinisoli TaxID=1899321 RepID=UPI0011C06C10